MYPPHLCALVVLKGQLVWERRGTMPRAVGGPHAREEHGSRKPEDRERFSEVFGGNPVQLCTWGCKPARWPRYYWHSCPFGAVFPELPWEVQPGQIRGGNPYWADEHERGARRPRGGYGTWATVVRSIPRERPPCRPARTVCVLTLGRNTVPGSPKIVRGSARFLAAMRSNCAP